MSSESIAVPESLLKQVRELAEEKGVTLEQFVSTAIAEKMAAWLTVDYLERRGAAASREKFEQALARVPDVEPEEHDRL